MREELHFRASFEKYPPMLKQNRCDHCRKLIPN